MRFVSTELESNTYEPDCLGEDDNRHTVHVKLEMADADAEDEQRCDDTTVEGDAAAQSAVAQGGRRP
jgi:hypothetical protein